MRTLHLTLKKNWFDMIASGEKKEEYREIKPYWVRRYIVEAYLEYSDTPALEQLQHPYGEMTMFDALKRDFDVIEFRNGYAKDASRVRVKYIDTIISTGNPEWGAVPNQLYFVIKLGEIIP